MFVYVTVIQCEALESSSRNSYYTCTNNLALGSTCTFYCRWGYRIVGSKITRTCRLTGEANVASWNGTSPICEKTSELATTPIYVVVSLAVVIFIGVSVGVLHRRGRLRTSEKKHGFSHQSDNTYEKISAKAPKYRPWRDTSKAMSSNKRGVATAVVHHVSGEESNDEVTYIEITTDVHGNPSVKRQSGTTGVNDVAYEISQADCKEHPLAGDGNYVNSLPKESLDELGYLVLPRRIEAPYTALRTGAMPGLRSHDESHSKATTKSNDPSGDSCGQHASEKDEIYEEIREEPVDDIGYVMRGKRSTPPTPTSISSHNGHGTAPTAAEDSIVSRISHEGLGYMVPKKHVEAPYTTLTNQTEASDLTVMKNPSSGNGNASLQVDDEYLVPDDKEETYTTIAEVPCDELAYVVPAKHIDTPYTALTSQFKTVEIDGIGRKSIGSSLDSHRADLGCVSSRIKHVKAPNTPLKQDQHTNADDGNVDPRQQACDKKCSREDGDGYLIMDDMNGDDNTDDDSVFRDRGRPVSLGYETTIPSIIDDLDGRERSGFVGSLATDAQYESIDYPEGNADGRLLQHPQCPHALHDRELEDTYDDTQAKDGSVNNKIPEYLEISN